jgi:hypothetical protein
MSNAIMSAPPVLPKSPEDEQAEYVLNIRRSRPRSDDVYEQQLFVKRRIVYDDPTSVHQLVDEVMKDQASSSCALAFTDRSEELHPPVDEDEDKTVLKHQNKNYAIAGSREVAAFQQQRVEKEMLQDQTRYHANIGSAFAFYQQQQLLGKAIQDDETRPLAILATGGLEEAARQQHQESFEIYRSDTQEGSHDDHDHCDLSSELEKRRAVTACIPFDQRIEKLMRYKEKFGNLDVPLKYSADDALGQWCSNIRHTHKRVVLGKKAENKNIRERINRLEAIGFNWETCSDFAKVFEERIKDLQKYKDEFGHCDVPGKFSHNRGLGNWCIRMRYSYKLPPKDGMTNPKRLSQAFIDRLEKMGFRWVVTVDFEKSFDDKVRDLEEFKKTYGHCHVPGKFAQNPSLGNWCNRMRYAYKRISQGEKTKSNLSEERMHRLEAMGFKWAAKNEL